MANKYMHLLNGKPAVFCDNGSTPYFATSWGKASRFSFLVDSLKQIRKNEDAVLRADPWTKDEFDYLRIKVD